MLVGVLLPMQTMVVLVPIQLVAVLPNILDDPEACFAL